MVPVFALLGEWKWAALVLVVVGSYAWGRHDGAALMEAECERGIARVTQAVETAQRGAAEAIAKLEVRHVTVQRRIERETREVPVYRDCVHRPDGVRIINDALENRALAAGDRELPGDAGAVARREFRGDDGKAGAGGGGVLPLPGGGGG